MAGNKKPRKRRPSTTPQPSEKPSFHAGSRVLMRHAPVVEESRNHLSLLFHMWVEVMIQGQGNDVICNNMAYAVDTCLMLARQGVGEEYMDVAILAIEALHRATTEGLATGVWAFRGTAVAHMCAVVQLYEEQFKYATIGQIGQADAAIERHIAELNYKTPVSLDETMMRLGDEIFSAMAADPAAPAADVELAEVHGIEVDLVHAMLDRYVASGKLRQRLEPKAFERHAFVRFYTVSADHRAQPLLPPEAPRRIPDESMEALEARAQRHGRRAAPRVAPAPQVRPNEAHAA